MTLKLAASTVLWGKLGTMKQFRQMLAEMKAIGYEGIGLEPSLLPDDGLRRPELVSEAIEAAGLTNAGSYSAPLPRDREWTVQSHTPLVWMVLGDRRRCEDAVVRLERAIQEYDGTPVIVTLHNHLRTCFETESEVKGALRALKDLKLCFDTAHAECSGINAIDFIRRHHDRIALLHVQDLRLSLPRRKIQFERDFVNIGKGVVNFKGIFRALRESGFGGYLMLETEASGGMPPLTLAREGYSQMSKLAFS